MAEREYFICSDGHKIAYKLWLPENNRHIRYFVQILHGFGEYSQRYERFATYLNKMDIGVFASDYRGHGYSIKEGEVLWFAEKDGWKIIANDQAELASYVISKYRGTPIFLLGQSLGCLVAGTLIIKASNVYSGAIMIGSFCPSKLTLLIAKHICNSQIKIEGSKASAIKLNAMSFEKFNRAFAPNKTSFDWVSSDEAEVAKIVKDPLCTSVGTYGMYKDVFCNIDYVFDGKNAGYISEDFPIYILSGENDSVGEFGKGPKKMFNLYKKAGISDLTLETVPNARHALLFEVGKFDTYNKIVSWMDERL